MPNKTATKATQTPKLTPHKRPSQSAGLAIKDLHASVDDKKILNGVNLQINPGEIHVIMGPNGSGKSTLCNVLMGHPKYDVSKGSITLGDKDITKCPTHKRANLGLFMTFQNPVEIPGISLASFLRTAKNTNLKANNKKAKLISPIEFQKSLKTASKQVNLDKTFSSRSLNHGFSGGEKKRAETLQMSILEPKFALIDEIDSGLDIDALRQVAETIKTMHKTHNTGILLITHYQRILDYITPNFVHIISKGKIIRSGDQELAKDLEKDGYQAYLK